MGQFGGYLADGARLHGLLPPWNAASGNVISRGSAPGSHTKECCDRGTRHKAPFKDQAAAEQAEAEAHAITPSYPEAF